jgi:hypothetical protein
MPLKVKELRNRADDAARNGLMHEQEGIVYNMPLVGQHFEQMLRAIGGLYEKDPLGLGLVTDYWCPADGGAVVERFPQVRSELWKYNSDRCNKIVGYCEKRFCAFKELRETNFNICGSFPHNIAVALQKMSISIFVLNLFSAQVGLCVRGLGR